MKTTIGIGIVLLAMASILIAKRVELTGQTALNGPISFTLRNESSEQTLLIFGILMGVLAVGLIIVGTAGLLRSDDRKNQDDRFG